MDRVNRRLFLMGGLATGGAVAMSGVALGGGRRAALDFPFELGVASGDPRPDGMVLWTRLAPKPLEPDGGMGDASVAVEWEIADNETFADSIKGTENATPAEGHSVHAEPAGLAPATEYFYRFRAEGHISEVGRTRTAPAAGSAPSSVKIAFASCAHYEQGFYHAYRDLAASAPDLVLFLGDYIYEKPTEADKQVRKYSYTKPIETLAQYRQRYAEHRTDANLRAAHAAAPWMPVFDDHELKNNWWGSDSDVPDSHKQSSFQAFWENMPLPRSMKPADAAIPLYRRIEWGTLARFHLLDTRQYRQRQAPDGDCDVINDGSRSLTGDTQEKWLLDGLAARDAGWDLLAQQVFFAQRDGDGKSSTCDIGEDSWDGYAPNRQRITQGWVDRKVRNPVVLTGDVHRAWANDLRVDYFKHESPVVGAELVTSSISSLGSVNRPDLSASPHVNYVGGDRGYVRATVTPEQIRAEFVAVSSALEEDPAKVDFSVAREFLVLDGKPGLQAP